MRPLSDEEMVALLERRINRLHLCQRLGIEQENEGRVFGQGINFFHIENWYAAGILIKALLRLTLLHQRGRRNALKIKVTEHEVCLPRLPAPWDGFTILQISDLHLDMNAEFPQVLGDRVRELKYDICVLTGDFRFRTHGPIDGALKGLEYLRQYLRGEVYAILGNHDSIRMVPAMEAMGIRMLLNEAVGLERDGRRLHLAGIDDAHYYRVDNIEKASAEIAPDEAAILLAHTPEIYKQAAHAGFDLMLCGHTHGGQICLPGGMPMMVNARCPRYVCRGAWRHHKLQGYTSVGAGSSVVAVRFNNRPEVVLHRLRSGQV